MKTSPATLATLTAVIAPLDTDKVREGVPYRSIPSR